MGVFGELFVEKYINEFQSIPFKYASWCGF